MNEMCDVKIEGHLDGFASAFFHLHGARISDVFVFMNYMKG